MAVDVVDLVRVNVRVGERETEALRDRVADRLGVKVSVTAGKLEGSRAALAATAL